jgi:branched-chain amino acid transport system ATP-binding protein
MAPLLELKDVHTYYGNIHALKGISLTVEQGEVVTLIGSNGAGKTTTLRTISGLLAPRQGQISLEGKRIDRVPAHDIVGMGVSQSPEGRRVFPRMTVRENLELGAFGRNDKPGIAEDMERALSLFPRLRERIGQRAGTMSGGEQQMLAIGRALMARPRVLLLDEPSMGLSPVLVEQIFQIIKDINKQGTTILLVEQNALMALGVASRGYVLQTGQIVLSDTATALSENEEVQKAYLGID